MIKRVLLVIGSLLLVSIIGLTAGYISVLKDKVSFYENVITDFGIDEFINYPYLYYEQGYIDQAKSHQCMWAIEDAINCESELYDIKEQCNVTE